MLDEEYPNPIYDNLQSQNQNNRVYHILHEISPSEKRQMQIQKTGLQFREKFLYLIVALKDKFDWSDQRSTRNINI